MTIIIISNGTILKSDKWILFWLVSFISDSDIISKGLTDEQGKFVTSLDISSVENFDIYANKSAFIQGHKAISVNSEVSDIILTNFYYESSEGFSTISYGSSININFEIKNISMFWSLLIPFGLG